MLSRLAASRLTPFNRFGLQYSTKTYKSGDLLVAVSELTKYGISLKQMPAITSIGPQSSGKTCVIEAICNKDILPKNQKRSTNKPIEMVTIRDDHESYKVGDKEFTDVIGVREEIKRANDNSHIKTISICVKGPELKNTRFIDLPGLFVVSEDDPKMPQRFLDITTEHLQNENYIPAIVAAGPTDPATNLAIQLVRQYSRQKHAIGILTKLDLTENQSTSNIKKMIGGKLYPMGYGWHPVVLRNQHDIKKGMTIEEKVKMEKSWFAQKSEFNPSGVPHLREVVSDILLEKLSDKLPEIDREIGTKIVDLRKSQSFLINLINSQDKDLSIRLELLIRKLVGSSLERAEFEETLKNQFYIHIKAHMEETIKHIEIEPHTFSNERMANTVHDDLKPSDYEQNHFRDLFSFGLISPMLFDQYAVNNAFTKECGLAHTIPWFDMVTDDPRGKKRIKWNKYLRTYFSTLLHDNKIQDLVYEITEREILDYIKNDPECNDELTQKFAEYIVKEIGGEAYNSHIKYSIETMIKTEQRPNIPLTELCRHLAQLYPEYLSFNSSVLSNMFRDNRRIKIDVYGNEWSVAYLRAIADNLAENCYRNVSVNLLDKMVQKLLEMTLDMFNKDHVAKEQNKVTEKINKLEELRTIVRYHLPKN